jgi:hypothetical protein
MAEAGSVESAWLTNLFLDSRIASSVVIDAFESSCYYRLSHISDGKWHRVRLLVASSGSSSQRIINAALADALRSRACKMPLGEHSGVWALLHNLRNLTDDCGDAADIKASLMRLNKQATARRIPALFGPFLTACFSADVLVSDWG